MSPQKKNKKAKPYSLEAVSRRELGIELDKTHQKADWSGELSSGMIEYAAKDAQVLLPIAEIHESKIKNEGLERVYEIEHRALPTVLWMQNAGLPFDGEGWKEYLAQAEEERTCLKEKLDALAPSRPRGVGWNWNSHLQIKEVFSLMDINLPNTKEDTLASCEHPFAGILLAYRKASKILSNYGYNFLKRVRDDGRIYASWRLIGAPTGRMSCSSPNLQQIPNEVLRRYVRAPKGRVIVSTDYSQAELRIAARITGDKRMLEAYRKGEDLHAATAKLLMGRENISKEERHLAKAVNFGFLYGQGVAGFREYARREYGITMTIEEARRYRERFFQTYPGLKAWHEREWRELKRGNTETRTLTGRRCLGVKSFTKRVNAPVQGSGADGQKLALALLHERRHECPGAYPVTCVHDSIVVECYSGDVEKVKDWVEKAMIDGMDEVLAYPGGEGPRIPIEVEVKVGKTWGV
jgi:DNA polymerase I